MASSTGKRSSSANKKRTPAKKTGSATSGKRKNSRSKQNQNDVFYFEMCMIGLFILMIILFLCNFGIIGPVGDVISTCLFGIFGVTAYVAPLFLFWLIIFWHVNKGEIRALGKIIGAVLIFTCVGCFAHIFSSAFDTMTEYHLDNLYRLSSINRAGGGVLAGTVGYFLKSGLGTVGCVLVLLLLMIIGIILLTEKSILNMIRDGSRRMRDASMEDTIRRKQQRDAREELRRQREEEKLRQIEEKKAIQEAKENDKILRMDKKVAGVAHNTILDYSIQGRHQDDMHEISYQPEDDYEESMPEADEIYYAPYKEDLCEPLIKSPIDSYASDDVNQPIEETFFNPYAAQNNIESGQSAVQPREPEHIIITKEDVESADIHVHKDGLTDGKKVKENNPMAEADREDASDKPSKAAPEKKKYQFPPLSRLQKGKAASGDSAAELKETALRLQQTLANFKVNVTITDISQGPTVTRYEFLPELGVSVKKVKNLEDDIKLSLAATDIRIEAPIPGKSAIGIEIPNKENTAVALRDLLESEEFQKFPSNLAFAVGKDIGGKTIVADIAKMPHMLIAGATGSGKSVCINTLIMSILYKAHPDDVKLIMVDPKVVELSVYNGIPHLLIPVVTDPKKASAALHWGVTEMEDRYRKFADYNVRDLKGYNRQVEALAKKGQEDAPAKLPQIVIIVDELADLMMVCPGEVEESICRLAQLARAAGIHLIIATQRPSVDVITGLIKANMPSRVAFSVSSGVDSRTILDMNGAEKLLGKGDMLFYPQGYTKPARIQGAFVSDGEVSDVVDFLKNQTLGNSYAEDIEDKIKSMGSGNASTMDESSSDLDELFEKAGRFIIEKDKASIGMLQRAFKIGFNRAARIMDQLAEMGVVGEEEGTKPRKILMGPEQFDQLVEEML